MTAESHDKSVSMRTNESSSRDIFIPEDRKMVHGGGKAHVVAKNFSIYYGDFEAVKKVNADILSKYVTAIIGPSGCGKSTFLRAINRMNDLIPACHTSGTLMFDGDDIYGKNTDEVLLRKKIGMVFQKPNPFPKSIFDNIAYGPRLHGINDRKTLVEIVEKSLRKAALWDEVSDRLDKNALGLSGGQQQRLCVARALAVEPEILLLDEPTSALDPKSTAKIEDLIEELRGSYTIMIVTHNMQQASRVSDYTMFFYEGVLVEYAPTKQLFTNPKDQMTEDYITGRFS
ncbi:phosphate ABC transporter ATP-binding protein [Prosthecochloris sp. ZM]|nr:MULTISPECIES: phosphate ABC transporter ATP-binding protein PstB [Prosthecochloris]NEX12516.1 phosphate ABC transporter ATP-binding protein [Prosthecochloris sp.]RDD31558.1 phosphate ABC transporter ATP-binding protein [Prosthecochloris sp. ZM]